MSSLRFAAPTPALDWLLAVQKQQAPQWLIEGFLQADAEVLVTGRPKFSQKTFLTLFAAIVVASGRPFGEVFRPTGARPVLFIEQEGGAHQTADRVIRLARTLGSSEEVLRNLFFWHRPVWHLDNPEDVERIVQFVEAYGIALVVLDTFARSFRGDENSSQDVGRALRGIQAIRRTGATVILVHHTRKEQHADAGGMDPDVDIRGSSAVPGAYEQHWALRFYTPGKDIDLLVLSKDDETRAFGLRWVFDNATGTIYPQIVRRALEDVGQITLDVRNTYVELLQHDVQYTREMLQAVWNLSVSQSAKLTVDMIASGQIRQVNYGRYMLA